MQLIVNEEIMLKQISRDHALELHSLVESNLELDLCYFCAGLKDTYKTLESTNFHIDDANSKFKEDGTPDLLIFYKSKLAGLISLSPLDKYQTKSEIGYWLGKEFEGKGLISLAFPFILDYAKNKLKLSLVELSTSIPNLRSQNLPKKFGFTKVKVIPNVETLSDGPVDHILWQHSLEDKMDNIILIGDDRVKAVRVQESNESIIDLTKEYPQFNFDHERFHVQKQSNTLFFARKTVGQKLSQAQTLLPSGINLLIKECYRPMWVQKGFWDGYVSFLQKKFPEWSDKQVYEECSKLNAPLDVAPHTTGGAVDLTLVGSNGQWLDMGTEFNASPLETNEATYTQAENISDEAKENRKMLVDVMTAVGFVNYPTEWWHWSYGDKYWALSKGQPYAIYGSKELE